MNNKIKIEKLVFGGQGLGRVDNKVVFVWNALPGEEVVFDYTTQKKNFAEGVAREILVSSPDRVAPRENHFLSCSAWQILSWKKELQYKKELAEEIYKKNGDIVISDLEIISDDQQYNYRNKIEYHFVEKDDQISLAIFLPESHEVVPVEECELARPELNVVAQDILVWLKAEKISSQNLQKIILRCNQGGEVLVGLFLKKKFNFASYPELKNNLIGFSLWQKSFRDDLIYTIGQDYLEEKIGNIKLRFGLLSFFQINVPVFYQALEDIKKFVGLKDKIIDYYAGVGAIGLSVGAQELVESNREAAGYVKMNIGLNKIKAEAICSSSERMVDLISADKTIIFDPPRAGLDKMVIEKILIEKPLKIIYMSCNLATQARDLGLLKNSYNIKFAKLYNFFPRTPHFEGLVVLEVKK